MDDALGRHIGPKASGFVRTVFSLHDPEEVRGLIRDASFQDVTVEATTMALRAPVPAEFLWQYLYATPLVAAVGQLDDERLGALERDIVEQAQGLVQDGGMTIPQSIVVATAKR